MEEMSPEMLERFEQATSSLKADMELRRLRETLEEAQVSLTVFRDMTVCWAFLATAGAQVQASMGLMPDNVARDFGLPVILTAIRNVESALARSIDMAERGETE